MSPFLAAIFLHGLCVANAINFKTVYEWNQLDFIWPSGADSSIEQIKDDYRPEYVFLQYMALFGERLFLTVESLPGIPATLVRLPTSGTSNAPPKLAPFPSWNLHEKDNCNSIQSVKGVETDPDGRLWVLDDGNQKCPGKLWIFNLVNHDSIERVHQFPETVVSNSYNQRWLHDIVLDITTDDHLAYITEITFERLIVYSRKMDKSWTVKTPGRKWEPSALSANREARQLYLGKYQSNELYSVSVSELKNEGGNATAKFIGEWTARPYRMLIDSSNVLYAAFFNQSYTSKWNISEPFGEQRIYEVGSLQAAWPFTFALDTNGTLWMTERNGTGSGNKYKLLKGGVGARSYLFSTSTDFSVRG
ncbi:major royal jelly protein 3-like [Cloeon dipterum]|uniref:major royal jelly protein 3-like n=1 Tax=Cloeon dipterum TaxID=197152 RepID=UPI0032202D8F